VWVSVSRETGQLYSIYLNTLLEWQERINLVSRETLTDLEGRHLKDSQQVGSWLEEIHPGAEKEIVDLGSGAGFPGMVLAIMGVGKTTLVESNGKKCAFLREVKRVTGVNVTIVQSRIERLKGRSFDVVVARGLAPLHTLLCYALPLLRPKGLCLFLKGKTAELEVEEARRYWCFNLEKKPSSTSEEGVLLLVSDLEKKI